MTQAEWNKQNPNVTKKTSDGRIWDWDYPDGVKPTGPTSIIPGGGNDPNKSLPAVLPTASTKVVNTPKQSSANKAQTDAGKGMAEARISGRPITIAEYALGTGKDPEYVDQKEVDHWNTQNKLNSANKTIISADGNTKVEEKGTANMSVPELKVFNEKAAANKIEYDKKVSDEKAAKDLLNSSTKSTQTQSFNNSNNSDNIKAVNDAMALGKSKVTPEEKKKLEWGDMLKNVFTRENIGSLASNIGSVFDRWNGRTLDETSLGKKLAHEKQKDILAQQNKDDLAKLANQQDFTAQQSALDRAMGLQQSRESNYMQGLDKKQQSIATYAAFAADKTKRANASDESLRMIERDAGAPIGSLTKSGDTLGIRK